MKLLSEQSNESKAAIELGEPKEEKEQAKPLNLPRPGTAAAWAPQAKQLCLWGSYV